jgi:uroporphyrinogen decarboxylase
MKPRDRLFMALNHKEPDRIPIDIGGTSCSTLIEPVYHKLLKKYQIKDNHYDMIHSVMRSVSICKEVKELLHSDTDILCVNEPAGGRIIMTENGFVDEWGIKYRRSKVGDDFYYDICENPLANAEIDDLRKYNWPDPCDLERYKGLRAKAKKISQKDFFVLGNILESSIFEVAWYLRGFQEFLIDIISNKKFAHALLERITSIQKTIYEKFLEEVGDYIDMIFIADDLATQENLLLSPKLYREMIKPYQKEYFNIKKRNDLKLLYHCCGDLYPILEDLIEIGVDAINPVQVSAREMEPTRLKKNYGGQITFWGGVDTQNALNSKNPELIVDSIRKIIEKLAPGGGFVLASVHNIQNDVPIENIKTMVDSAVFYGKYKT